MTRAGRSLGVRASPTGFVRDPSMRRGVSRAVSRIPYRARSGGRADRSGYGGGAQSTPRPSARSTYTRDRYYSRRGIGLRYCFGPSQYWGMRYYSPYHHVGSGVNFAFFYSAPVAYTYVPFGFYGEFEPIYVTRSEEVVDDYPVEEYETETIPEEEIEVRPFGQEEEWEETLEEGEWEEPLEEGDSLPRFGDPEEDEGVDPATAIDPRESLDPEGQPDAPQPVKPEGETVPETENETGAEAERDPLRLPQTRKPGRFVDPVPAAGSPAVEKFLRTGSSAFLRADYEEAAEQFRLAALAIPGDAAPLFALGQSLIALGRDEYAARVIRRAIRLNPDLVDEPGDIAGVYQGQEEFDRVMVAVEERAARPAANTDTKFVLAVQRYYSGDPRCLEYLSWLHGAVPADKVAEVLLEGARKRFERSGSELPPIAGK